MKKFLNRFLLCALLVFQGLLCACSGRLLQAEDIGRRPLADLAGDWHLSYRTVIDEAETSDDFDLSVENEQDVLELVNGLKMFDGMVSGHEIADGVKVRGDVGGWRYSRGRISRTLYFDSVADGQKMSAKIELVCLRM